MQAAGTTTFSMAMRPDADERMVDATELGTTTNRIIEKYGLPIPESLDYGDLAHSRAARADGRSRTVAAPAPSPTTLRTPRSGAPVPSLHRPTWCCAPVPNDPASPTYPSAPPFVDSGGSRFETRVVDAPGRRSADRTPCFADCSLGTGG